MNVEEMKEAIVCRVQHELRTPLTIASMAYEMLASRPGGAQEDQYKAMLGCALKSLERHMLNLTLLPFSEGMSHTLCRARADLMEIAGAAIRGIEALSREREVALEFSASGPRRAFHIDAGLIEIALVNLLENAIRFNRPGGRVSLTIAFRERDAVLRIEDNGIGIPQKDLELALSGFHQAEDFMTRREGGLGIGLAAARRIIERHGGALAAASAVGRGSAFTITLPEEHRDV